jgi:hypothetical protein
MVDPAASEVTLQTFVERFHAVGAELAELLADEGFRWMPWPGVLSRQQDHRFEEIHLDGLPDRPGRPAERVTTRLHVAIRDRGLQSWRFDAPQLVLSKGDFLVGHPVGYPTGAATAQLDLRDAAGPDKALSDLVAMIRDRVLPWFEATREPEQLARTAPLRTLRAGGFAIVEWLASRARRDLISAALDRVLTAYPNDRTNYEHGRQIAARSTRPLWLSANHDHNPASAVTGEPGKGFIDAADRLGWSAAKHGDPQYQPPVEAASMPAAGSPGASGTELRPLRGSDGSPLTVVITGRLEALTRQPATTIAGIHELTRTQANDLVLRYGGKPTDSVSRHTDLVIAGERAGEAKTGKAMTLGVPIMPPSEFTRLSSAYEDHDTDRAAWIVATHPERPGHPPPRTPAPT